jgi:iron(III) transport system permease protein
VLPALALVWTSLGLLYQRPELASLSLANLDNYRRLFTSDWLGRTTANTLTVAVTAATGTMLLASSVAWLAIRRTGALAVGPDRLTVLNFATPAIVAGLALSVFYAWLPPPIYGTVWIIVIALSTRFLTYTTRLMAGAYVQIHRELEEVAALSGANLLSTLRRIVLPLVWPAFAGGWLWVFVNALRDTVLSIMLLTVGNETLGAQLWILWFSQGESAQAAALAVCLAVVSVLLSLGIIRTSMRQQTA